MVTILFDIDRTLINTRGAGAFAMRRSFRRLFSVRRPSSVPFAGRTDRAIASDLFAAHQVDDSQRNWELFAADYVQRLPRALSRFQGETLPGVLPLLAQLADRDRVALGLLTGNMQPAAFIKLRHFTIEHYFAFGGYGDAHRQRDDVARVAVKQARTTLQSDFDDSRLWVIGDTVHDVTCGRAVGARTIAVCTGATADELRAVNPDFLFDDLSDTQAVLETLELM